MGDIARNASPALTTRRGNWALLEAVPVPLRDVLLASAFANGLLCLDLDPSVFGSSWSWA